MVGCVYHEYVCDSKIMDGLANTYKESGWLPEWASPGHRGCMIGSNSASIIADAYLKGVPNMDMETLFDAIIKNTKGYYEDVYICSLLIISFCLIPLVLYLLLWRIFCLCSFIPLYLHLFWWELIFS